MASRPRRIEYHSACLLFPMLGQDELRELADDIRTNGLRHSVVLCQGKVLDGRNRLAACKIAGVEPTFTEWSGPGSPLEWVISENLVRRHLTASQRAVIAYDLLPMLEKQAKERQRLSNGRGKKVRNKVRTFSTPGEASEVAARLANCNSRYVKILKAINRSAPEVIEKVRSGDISIAEADLPTRPRAVAPARRTDWPPRL